MSSHLRTALGVSAFVGLAATAANAAESRNTNFLFTCDGTNKTINFVTTGGLGNSVTRLIQGAEISLFENRGGLQYVILRAQGDPNKQLLTLGGVDNSRSNQFTGFIPFTTSATGTLTLTIDGACNGGFGQVQGNVTVWIF